MDDISEMQQRLVAFVARQLGTETVSVSGLRRLPGGASREIWSLDISYEHDGVRENLPLVLRRDRPGAAVETRRCDEFQLLHAAHAEGVPVPKVHWLADDAQVLGAPFFIMDRIDGETIARRLLRDDAYAHAREVMTA